MTVCCTGEAGRSRLASTEDVNEDTASILCLLLPYIAPLYGASEVRSDTAGTYWWSTASLFLQSILDMLTGVLKLSIAGMLCFVANNCVGQRLVVKLFDVRKGCRLALHLCCAHSRDK